MAGFSTTPVCFAIHTLGDKDSVHVLSGQRQETRKYERVYVLHSRAGRCKLRRRGVDVPNPGIHQQFPCSWARNGPAEKKWLVTFVTEVSLRLAAPRTGGALYRRYLASRLALSSPDLFSSAPTTDQGESFESD